MSSVDGPVLAVLGHLHQLVDGVQQAVAVLLQQPLVEPLVSEAHFKQHRHHGRVLSGGGVDASLQRRNKPERRRWMFVCLTVSGDIWSLYSSERLMHIQVAKHEILVGFQDLM